ncbi:hypothetical protein BIFDEN_01941 [Bifidobacterium dentium ATCC 27678]|nr:hypothetical protein BIFDEN_01941 [Bifidobacterium dentium ATCC 27678]
MSEPWRTRRQDWELASTLLDKLGRARRPRPTRLGISFYPS